MEECPSFLSMHFSVLFSQMVEIENVLLKVWLELDVAQNSGEQGEQES